MLNAPIVMLWRLLAMVHRRGDAVGARRRGGRAERLAAARVQQEVLDKEV